MSIPWLPVFFKNRFLFITPAILGSPVCGSNGLTVSIFPRFYLLYLMCLPVCRKNVRNFKQNFAQKEGNR